MTSLSDFTVHDIDGQPFPLAAQAGRVVLVVNTASRCGFTPQYRALEQLHRDYQSQGLVVLGFPCDQFGGQEPGTEGEIAAFCADQYQVGFPLMSKVEVNGPAAEPLFRWLARAAPGLLGTTTIKWNFTKFLVDRAGTGVTRFAPRAHPDALRPAIEALL